MRKLMSAAIAAPDLCRLEIGAARLRPERVLCLMGAVVPPAQIEAAKQDKLAKLTN